MVRECMTWARSSVGARGCGPTASRAADQQHRPGPVQPVLDGAARRAHDRAVTNPLCPDYSSHEQNAADLLVPDWRGRSLSAEESEQVDAAAEAEYRACEGH